MHQLFTISGHDYNNISLPDISYLYSIIDFRELTQNYSTKFALGHSSRINVKQSFKFCFEKVADQIPNMGKNSYYDEIMKTEDFMYTTYPCSLEKEENFSECREYCKWHKDFFEKWSRNNFLTVMRYALPQRKLNLEPIERNEKELAGIYSFFMNNNIIIAFSKKMIIFVSYFLRGNLWQR